MIGIFQFAYQSIKQEVMTDHLTNIRHIVLYLIIKQDKMAHYFKKPQLNIFFNRTPQSQLQPKSQSTS